MEESHGFWPWNIGEGWRSDRSMTAKVRAKIDKAAYIAAEIASGTWDFEEMSVPRHKDKSLRVPINYVMARSGWSPLSTECRKYLKSHYFVLRFQHEMDMRSQGLTKELAKLSNELAINPEVTVLKEIGITALKTIHDRIMDEHQVNKFSNRDLLSLAQFGLNMDAKLTAAKKSRDESTPTFSVQADVMQVLNVNDPRMDELKARIDAASENKETAE